MFKEGLRHPKTHGSSSVPLQGACGQEMEHHSSRGGLTSAGLASSLTFLSVEIWAARRSRFVGWQLHELPSVGILGAHGPGQVGIHPPPFCVPPLSPGTTSMFTQYSLQTQKPRKSHGLQ